MRTDIYFESCGTGNIRAGIWTPAGEPVAVLQILHGIAEHIERYENFARYLNQQGILVVAADHMGHGKSIGTKGIQGYFHGGWFSAVEDAYQLLNTTRKQYPNIPYILFVVDPFFKSPTPVVKYETAPHSVFFIICPFILLTPYIVTSLTF